MGIDNLVKAVAYISNRSMGLQSYVIYMHISCIMYTRISYVMYISCIMFTHISYVIYISCIMYTHISYMMFTHIHIWV